LSILRAYLAGPLFENFCIQETLKAFFNRARQPWLYYLRTGNGLEVDLLIEGPAQSLVPVEIKLSKTPVPKMGENIERFRKLYSALTIREGLIVSLTDSTIRFSPDLSSVTFADYLKMTEKLVG